MSIIMKFYAVTKPDADDFDDTFHEPLDLAFDGYFPFPPNESDFVELSDFGVLVKVQEHLFDTEKILQKYPFGNKVYFKGEGQDYGILQVGLREMRIPLDEFNSYKKTEEAYWPVTICEEFNRSTSNELYAKLLELHDEYTFLPGHYYQLLPEQAALVLEYFKPKRNIVNVFMCVESKEAE
jgi:hypothetical protein